MKTKRRIYMGDAPLIVGPDITLGDAHANYLHSVLRLKAGDEVHVFNAAHGEWVAEIKSSKKSEVKIQIQQQTRAPMTDNASRLTLAFAPLKKDRTDFLVEKASELGVHVLQPIFTDHTQSDRVNTERLQTTAIEAAEQCDRLDAPQVLSPVKLENYLERLPKDALVFLAAESGDALPIAAAFESAKTDVKKVSAVHFLIGPEGGFSSAEFQRFDRHLNIRRIRLGPRLLRAETAAAAVLSTFQAVIGDWI